jgi:hypothetical protein
MQQKKATRDRIAEEPDSTKAELMQESGHARKGAREH